MTVTLVGEYNAGGALLYVETCPGACARGRSFSSALGKVEPEVRAWLDWRGAPQPEEIVPVIVQQKESPALQIADADSDVLFDSERPPLSAGEYAALKALALRSAADFQRLYDAIPDKDRTSLPLRETFYGARPRTAREMYEHTKNVNAYYFGELGAATETGPDILAARRAGFDALEQMPGYLDNPVCSGSYDELWNLRKLLRRFLWHDRIHAKAMLRMAARIWGADALPDPFCQRGLIAAAAQSGRYE